MQKLITLIPLFFSSQTLFCQEATVDSTGNNISSSWSVTASEFYYFIPDHNTSMFTASADHRSLHLETRYNYEDYNTVSAFAGLTFKGGDKVQFDIKPMMGVVAGNTNGFAPALEADITYKIFDFYSESEFVIDMNHGSGKEE